MSVVAADCAGAYEGGCFGASVGGIIGHPHVGATIGAIVAGVYSSYKIHDILTASYSGQTRSSIDQQTPMVVVGAYNTLLNENVNLKNNYPQTMSVVLPEEKRELQDIGAIHNLALNKIMTNNVSLSNVDSNLSLEERQIINNAEFLDSVEQIACRIKDQIMSQQTITNSGHDISDKLMNLFTRILEEYPDDSYDVEFIINRYIEAINSTDEIPQDQKDLLYQSLGVAASSFEYWEQFLEQEE